MAKLGRPPKEVRRDEKLVFRPDERQMPFIFKQCKDRDINMSEFMRRLIDENMRGKVWKTPEQQNWLAGVDTLYLQDLDWYAELAGKSFQRMLIDLQDCLDRNILVYKDGKFYSKETSPETFREMIDKKRKKLKEMGIE